MQTSPDATSFFVPLGGVVGDRVDFGTVFHGRNNISNIGIYGLNRTVQGIDIQNRHRPDQGIAHQIFIRNRNYRYFSYAGFGTGNEQHPCQHKRNYIKTVHDDGIKYFWKRIQGWQEFDF